MLTPLLSVVALLSLSQAAPRFERAPCPIEVAPGERIDCGLLTVPENRRKADSRSIRLPVMIFRSRAATPAADPILFMPGGLGGSAVANRSSGKNNRLLDDRDFILLEPRGAKFSQPALECPEVNALGVELNSGRLRGPRALQTLASTAGRCRAALASQGVDLDGYTTEATADDLEDLRKALGHEKWNLYGFSYSTRLMLTVLRKHPGGVRSVILDSVLPPDVNFDEVATANLQRSLNLVFDGCAIDRDCGAAHPHLRERFARLVASADRHPLALNLPSTQVRGAQVVEALYSALHDASLIPLLPRIISRAAAGDYTELAPLVKGNQGPSSFTWGLRYSVWCADEFPFEDPARMAAQRSPALGLGGIDESAASPEVCRAWNVTASPAVENEPVKSDVPALILAGEFDPDTPPDWGRQLLETLPNAHFVELRGLSHGASFSPCGSQLLMAFLKAPGTAPPAGCALQLRGADFGLSARP